MISVRLNQVDCLKRFACFEGARQTYVCVKTQFRKVDVTFVADGHAKGKHRTVEEFFDEVAEGARMTKVMCPKDTLYF